MTRAKTFTIVGLLIGTLSIGVWAIGASAVNNQADEPVAETGITTQDFNPANPNQYPDLTNIDISIVGVTNIGVLHMIEGIDNETTVQLSGTSFENTGTRYARLVMHGVFHKQMRDWRNEIINGRTTTRRIDMNIRDASGTRRLEIRFHNCMPVRFTLPPFSLDGSTRYQERMEFVYTHFEIRD